jgi:hypothetical protein
MMETECWEEYLELIEINYREAGRSYMRTFIICICTNAEGRLCNTCGDNEKRIESFDWKTSIGKIQRRNLYI